MLTVLIASDAEQRINDTLAEVLRRYLDHKNNPDLWGQCEGYLQAIALLTRSTVAQVRRTVAEDEPNLRALYAQTGITLRPVLDE